MNDRKPLVSTRRAAELGLLLTVATLVGLYCYDAVRASTDILNLVFVLPVALLVLGLCFVQFIVEWRRNSEFEASTDRLSQVLPAMGLFAGYVLTLPWLGFDVGSAVFLCCFLWLHGERRWPLLIGYSVSFAVLVSYFFARMLPYPLPLLFL